MRFWVDDFPNFPFGGICDRFGGGYTGYTVYAYLTAFLYLTSLNTIRSSQTNGRNPEKTPVGKYQYPMIYEGFCSYQKPVPRISEHHQPFIHYYYLHNPDSLSLVGTSIFSHGCRKLMRSSTEEGDLWFMAWGREWGECPSAPGV